MASYPIPITRIEGGGYVTDVDAWGRTIASNLPPTHIIHRELEGLKQQAEEHASDNQILRETIHEYKRKVGELRAKLRTEATADIRPTHASLYQRVDSAISTADANILRAILREVCRESEKAANIAASILPSPRSPVSERSTATRGSTSTTRTTSTRRTSVRFQEPPVPVSGFRPTTTRRASSRVQDLPVPANADLSAGTAKEHDRGMRKRREKVTDELSGDYFDPGYTTPRRPKRRAEDEVEEPSSRKRRSTVPLTCATCKKEYNPTENERGGCKRHSGEFFRSATVNLTLTSY